MNDETLGVLIIVLMMILLAMLTLDPEFISYLLGGGTQ